MKAYRLNACPSRGRTFDAQPETKSLRDCPRLTLLPMMAPKWMQ